MAVPCIHRLRIACEDRRAMRSRARAAWAMYPHRIWPSRYRRLGCCAGALECGPNTVGIPLRAQAPSLWRRGARGMTGLDCGRRRLASLIVRVVILVLIIEA